MRSIKKIEPVKARSPVRKTRVAAYCRVSTGSEEQLVSLEAQKKHYEETITADPSCEFAGLYYDEGITGTKQEVRPALMRMMVDCEAGLIDRIVTNNPKKIISPGAGGDRPQGEDRDGDGAEKRLQREIRPLKHRLLRTLRRHLPADAVTFEGRTRARV